MFTCGARLKIDKFHMRVHLGVTTSKNPTLHLLCSPNPTDKANLFNSHFVSQFTDPSKYDIVVNNSDYSVCFSVNEVYVALSSLDASKACGDDGIPGRVLKHCAGSLSYPLWLLFNISISRVGSGKLVLEFLI